VDELLNAFDTAVRQPDLLIALDRDGTIVPYAQRPEQAHVDDALRRLMDRLSECCNVRVAIISARSSAQLQGDFFGQNLILAGNYGLEVHFPDGQTAVQPQAVASLPVMKELRDELATRLNLQSGIIIEDHGYSLCVHWHLVPLPERESMHNTVTAVADQFPTLSVKKMPTSYEILPDFPWDKGLALAFIDRQTTKSQGRDRFYIFAGDSESDTPAFNWVNEHGGISIRVGPTESLGAQYRLDQPADLCAALNYLSHGRKVLRVA
jgi:trehalose-phosphatase